MNPFISVVIRLYNGIEFLDESLNSVVNQSYTNWELIIGINSHGPEGGEVLKMASALVESRGDKRVSVINYPNVRGGAEALNAISSDAKGEWVAFLDVDDKWHPRKLEAQVSAIYNVKPCPDVIGTFCVYFGRMTGSPSIPGDFINPEVFKQYNPIINSSVLMKKNLVNFTDRFLDDYDLWCRLILQGKIFFNIPNMLVYHRVHDGSYYNSSNKQDPEAIKRKYFPSE